MKLLKVVAECAYAEPLEEIDAQEEMAARLAEEIRKTAGCVERNCGDIRGYVFISKVTRKRTSGEDFSI